MRILTLREWWQREATDELFDPTGRSEIEIQYAIEFSLPTGHHQRSAVGSGDGEDLGSLPELSGLGACI